MTQEERKALAEEVKELVSQALWDVQQGGYCPSRDERATQEASLRRANDAIDRLASAAPAAQATEAEAFERLWRSNMPRFVADGAKEDAQQWFSAGWQACAAAPAAQATGEWVMVPREPTQEMDDAGYATLEARDRGLGYNIFRVYYRAMLAAAPAAPVQLEPVAWIDRSALEELEQDGWCVVHAAQCDPGSDHCADIPLFAHPLTERYLHVKSGGLYDVVCEAKREEDGLPLIVYRGVATGLVWVRPASEFYDGRFTIERAHGIGEQPTQYGDKSRLSHDTSTSGPEEAPQEVAWLIESRLEGPQTTWWNGVPEGAGPSFTSDPSEAVRFARREDAERVAQHMQLALVTEHIWM